MKHYLFIFSLLFIETKSFNIQRRNFLDGIINFHNGLFVSSNINSNEVDIREINNNIMDNNQGIQNGNEHFESFIVENNNNDIYFYGAVTMASCYSLKNQLIELNTRSKLFKAQFNSEPPPIRLHIQSPGGSLLHSFYIIDLIQSLDTPVYTYIDGFAASAATLISVVGKKRFITKNSLMLIHQLSASEDGKYNQLKDSIDNFDTMMNNICNIYLKNTHLNESTLAILLSHDLWLNSETAYEYGLVDEII